MPWIDSKTTDDPPHVFEISERALVLYEQIRVLKCCCPPQPSDARYWEVPDDCPPCEAFASLNHELARLIRLPCYEVYCVPPPHGEGSIPESEEARRDMFEAAVREKYKS
jgi:hypothetical protein